MITAFLDKIREQFDKKISVILKEVRVNLTKQLQEGYIIDEKIKFMGDVKSYFISSDLNHNPLDSGDVEPYTNFEGEPNGIVELKKIINALYNFEIVVAELEKRNIVNLSAINTVQELIDLLGGNTTSRAYKAAQTFGHLDFDFLELFSSQINSLYCQIEAMTQNKDNLPPTIADLLKLEPPSVQQVGVGVGTLLTQMQPDAKQVDFDFLAKFSSLLPSYLADATSFIKSMGEKIGSVEPEIYEANIKKIETNAIDLINAINSAKGNNAIMAVKFINYIRILHNIVSLSTETLQQLNQLGEASKNKIRMLVTLIKQQVSDLQSISDEIEDKLLLEPGTLSAPLNHQLFEYYYNLVIHYAEKPESLGDLTTLEDREHIERRVQDCYLRIFEADAKRKEAEMALESFEKFFIMLEKIEEERKNLPPDLIKKFNDRSRLIDLHRHGPEYRKVLLENYPLLQPYIQKFSVDMDSQIVYELTTTQLVYDQVSYGAGQAKEALATYVGVPIVNFATSLLRKEQQPTAKSQSKIPKKDQLTEPSSTDTPDQTKNTQGWRGYLSSWLPTLRRSSTPIAQPTPSKEPQADPILQQSEATHDTEKPAVPVIDSSSTEIDYKYPTRLRNLLAQKEKILNTIKSDIATQNLHAKSNMEIINSIYPDAAPPVLTAYKGNEFELHEEEALKLCPITEANESQPNDTSIKNDVDRKVTYYDFGTVFEAGQDISKLNSHQLRILQNFYSLKVSKFLKAQIAYESFRNIINEHILDSSVSIGALPEEIKQKLLKLFTQFQPCLMSSVQKDIEKYQSYMKNTFSAFIPPFSIKLFDKNDKESLERNTLYIKKENKLLYYFFIDSTGLKHAGKINLSEINKKVNLKDPITIKQLELALPLLMEYASNSGQPVLKPQNTTFSLTDLVAFEGTFNNILDSIIPSVKSHKNSNYQNTVKTYHEFRELLNKNMVNGAVNIAKLPSEIKSRAIELFTQFQFYLIDALEDDEKQCKSIEKDIISGLQPKFTAKLLTAEDNVDLMLYKENTLYVKKDKKALRYYVLDPYGKKRSDVINLSEIRNKFQFTEPLTIKQIEAALPILLDITTKNSHTLPPAYRANLNLTDLNYMDKTLEDKLSPAISFSQTQVDKLAKLFDKTFKIETSKKDIHAPAKLDNRLDKVIKRNKYSEDIKKLSDTLNEQISKFFNKSITSNFKPSISGVPFPDIEDSQLPELIDNASGPESTLFIQYKQLRNIKRLMNTLYYLQQTLAQMEQLNDNYFGIELTQKGLYLYHIIQAFRHISSFKDTFTELQNDPHLSILFKEFKSGYDYLKKKIETISAPYTNEPPVDSSKAPGVVHLNKLWYTLHSFMLIPSHIEAAYNKRKLTTEDLEQIKIDTKRIEITLERVMNKSDSYFKLFFEIPSIYSAFNVLKTQLSKFMTTLYTISADERVQFLEQLKNEYFAKLLIEVDSYEAELGLNSACFSCGVQKVFEEFYKGLLEPFNLVSKRHLSCIESLNAYDKRIELIDTKIKNTKEHLDRNIENLATVKTLLDAIHRYKAKIKKKDPTFKIEEALLLNAYQEANPILFLESRSFKNTINSALFSDDLSSANKGKIFDAVEKIFNYLNLRVNAYQLEYQSLIEKSNNLIEQKNKQEKDNIQYKKEYITKLFNKNIETILNNQLPPPCLIENYKAQLHRYLASFQTNIENEVYKEDDINKAINAKLVDKIEDFNDEHLASYQQLNNVILVLNQFNAYATNTIDIVNQSSKTTLFENTETITKKMARIKTLLDLTGATETLPEQKLKSPKQRIQEIQAKILEKNTLDSTKNFEEVMLAHRDYNVILMGWLIRFVFNILSALHIYTPPHIKHYQQIISAAHIGTKSKNNEDSLFDKNSSLMFFDAQSDKQKSIMNPIANGNNPPANKEPAIKKQR